MKKPEKTIKQTIGEMCLYWNVSYAHELKTIRQFKKMITDLDRAMLTQITPDGLMRLYIRLRNESKGTDESVSRQFDYVRRVFKYAHAQGYIRLNPCQLLRLPKCKRGKIVSLTKEELTIIENAKPVSMAQQRVRDWFLFQCYTGLAFSDFKYFDKRSVTLLHGKMYVAGTRRKTGTEFIFPLTAKALALAVKYNYHFACGCIQKYNMGLKKLQLNVEIATVLTTHVARRTFGQLMIDDGVPLETVSRMLGHSTTSMTERSYARVGLSRVVRDMQRMAA